MWQYFAFRTRPDYYFGLIFALMVSYGDGSVVGGGGLIQRGRELQTQV